MRTPSELLADQGRALHAVAAGKVIRTRCPRRLLGRVIAHDGKPHDKLANDDFRLIYKVVSRYHDRRTGGIDFLAGPLIWPLGLIIISGNFALADRETFNVYWGFRSESRLISEFRRRFRLGTSFYAPTTCGSG
jgi:hypothetical protein